VWRVAALSGRPKYEKAIMLSLKLDTPIHKMVILRNTPEINYKLWQVKHLLRIKPLSFPDGIPSQDNFKAFLLKRNGQFVQSKLSRENYRRERNRPELEKYVLLREEQECGMRHKWFVGSLDGTLLPTLSIHSHPTVLPENMGKAQLGKGCTSTARKRRDM
jgi:ribosomal protein L30/L7E